MIFDIFRKKEEPIYIEDLEPISLDDVEEKAITASPIISKNTQLLQTDPWSEKKDLTQEEMLSQYKSWAFVCARLNGESVASQKLRLYATTSPNQKRIKNFDTKQVDTKTFKRLSKNINTAKPIEMIEEIYDHPVLDLLYNVNEFSNYFDNMQLTQTYMDICGSAFLYIVFDRDGVPVELHQMRPDFTKIVPGKQRLIKGYLYGNTKPVALSTEEVIRFYVPNPANPYLGKSCIEAGSAEISRNNLYNVYENSQLKNNGRPDFIIKYDGQLTAQDQKRLTMEWNRLYQGVQNAGKIKVMDQNFEVERLSFNPKDMEFLQGRVFTKKDIASLFGVPYGLLDTSDQLKAGLDNLLSYYARFAIMPRLRRIEETLNEQLIPFFDNTGDLFFKFDSPIDDDKQFIANTNVAYVNAGIISVNEAREREDYDAVEGGDELKINNSGNQAVGNGNAPSHD